MTIMKKLNAKLFLTLLGAALIFVSCGPAENANTDHNTETASTEPAGGQASVVDDVSQPDIVKIVGSKDHTTLVAALQAAAYVDVLANAGPFTVFAPVNSAFDALPAGTLDELVKPENQEKLRRILEHHVTTTSYSLEMLQDGQVLGMADGGNATIKVDGDKYSIDGANILASVKATNGMVHVVDALVMSK